MYVESIPNRNSLPAILLRESYRDGDKIRKRTLAKSIGLAINSRAAARSAPSGELGVEVSPDGTGTGARTAARPPFVKFARICSV